MNRASTFIVTLAVLAVLPLAATPVVAMPQMDAQSTMDHGGMNTDHGKMEMGPSGMNMQGDMIMLGDAVQDGVKAMAHLKDVHEAMAKMGMQTTHHLMVMFADLGTGKPISSGVAAVKIKQPNGDVAGPIKLMGMQGHFGADVELPGPGQYHFTIGSKLADGKQRQFDFDFTLK